MARYVSEIIHHELFMLSPEITVRVARDSLLALGITGAPVLDARGTPVGVVSLRDLIAGDDATPVSERMMQPVDTVEASATIERAAFELSDRGRHRLVVVDDDGLAVGVVSAIDIIRGMLGLPCRFSAGFPHVDPQSGLAWSDNAVLDLDHVEVAPAAPGLLVIVHSRPGWPDRPVWVEASHQVRARLYEILSDPVDMDPVLRAWVAEEGRHLLFRAAEVRDPRRRAQALERFEAKKKPAWLRQPEVR